MTLSQYNETAGDGDEYGRWNWGKQRKELVGNIMNAVEAVSSDWDREALRSYAEDVADSFQSGRIDEKGLAGIDENEKDAIRSAVEAVLLERKIGKFYADNENDATDHLHLPPDIAEAQKKLMQLRGPDAPDWRIPIWAEAENVLSAHGADAANDFLAANGLDPQY